MRWVVRRSARGKGYDITDLEYSETKPGAMYPEIGHNLAKKIQSGEYTSGILLCGTGLGMSMAANKVEGVYAAVCHDVYPAKRVRASNAAQILTMGERVVGAESAKTVVDAWLASDYEGGSSAPKVEQMRELEKREFGAQ